MKIIFKLIVLICLSATIFSCNTNSNQTSGNKNSHKIDSVKADTATPIDCPLRKQGINMDHMKPFAETEKYIEFLERKDRIKWQKPDTIISAMALKGNEAIADIGAGSGYFSFRFASKLVKGKVVAIDIDPEMIRHIHHKAMSSEIKNIDIVLAKEDDPNVPENVNVVFICDMLHHLKNRADWLSKLYSEINKGTRLILIEFKEGILPQGPPEKMKISAKEMETIVTGAGFILVKKNTSMLPYQNYFEFIKK